MEYPENKIYTEYPEIINEYMEYLEIINEYNRNIRSKDMSRDETWRIFKERIGEYKKTHPYTTDFQFLYPEIIGWNESWLELVTLKFDTNKKLNNILEKTKDLSNDELRQKYAELQIKFDNILAHTKNILYSYKPNNDQNQKMSLADINLEMAINGFKEYCEKNQIEY